MANGIRDLPDEEPPSSKDSIKLCIPSSGDIRSVIFGCRPLLAGANCFRSLALFSQYRRNRILETNTNH